MKKCIRKNLILVIVIVLIFSLTSISFASEVLAPTGMQANAITPNWTGLNTVSYNFSILSGALANPIISGTTYSGAVDYVNVNVDLKKSSGSSWITIKSWNKNITIALNKFTFNETYAVSTSYSYKYSATVKSYKNGVLLYSVSFDSNTISY